MSALDSEVMRKARHARISRRFLYSFSRLGEANRPLYVFGEGRGPKCPSIMDLFILCFLCSRLGEAVHVGLGTAR